MADEDLMAQFQEFLESKKAAENDAAANEDFDVEIWDETGKGVRTKRSHAKPFLQQLGIDVDPEPANDGDKDASKGDKKPPTGRTAGSTAATGTARKYFKKA